MRIDPKWVLSQAAMQSRDFHRGFMAQMATVSLDKTHVEAHRQLAALFLPGKKSEDAKEHAQPVLEVKPNDTQAAEILAQSYAGLGDLDTTEKGLRKNWKSC